MALITCRPVLKLLDSVCRQILKLADIFLIFLTLSASKLWDRQTFSGFPCFYLPPNCGTGRHLLLFSCFVCRLNLWLADIIQISLLLSATNCGTGRHLLLFSCFVCRLKWWLADIFLFLLILSADTTWTWQTYLDFPRFVCRQTEPGRRFLDFINFVCRQMFEAGIFYFVMFAY